MAVSCRNYVGVLVACCCIAFTLNCKTTQASGKIASTEIKSETARIWQLVTQSNLAQDIKVAIGTIIKAIDTKSEKLGERTDAAEVRAQKLEVKAGERDAIVWTAGIIGALFVIGGLYYLWKRR